tara:strand:+ start:1 stop:1437 length:1437 start_codon:yes stop_codon:yes gene_type:complete
MEHQPGTIPAASHNNRNSDRGVVAIMAPAINSGLGGAESLKVDQWNVDNLRLDGNTVSTTDTNGDLILDPNGTGRVIIPDNTLLVLGSNSSSLEYDQDNTNKIQINGASWVYNNDVEFDGNTRFGDIEIKDNIISTIPGSGDIMYLDPHPDGLSNEGTVIIKGDLQVDGTTTTINSTSKTLNDPIFHIGDVTSTRTVMVDANSGATSLTLDSVVGINTGDSLAGTGIANNTTVLSYNTSNKSIALNIATTAGISSAAQITITHGFDSNTDRGISFAFNTSSGSSNNKTGFFGMDDSSIAEHHHPHLDNHGTHADDSRRWTYIPDATISNNVVTGTKGFLDIKGIYYQSGDYSTGGVVYFDDDGLQRSTNAVASPVSTSKQILTAVTKNTLDLTVAITASEGDIIIQDTTGAFGIVETDVTASTNVDLIGVEGTFNTTNNLRKESSLGSNTNLSSYPTTVTVIYNNKPQWTSTLDGGAF